MVKQILLTIPIEEFETIIRDCVRSELKNSKAEPPPKTEINFIRIKEAAAILGISRPTLKAYSDAGYLKKYRVGFTYRYRKDEVVKCLQLIPSIKHSRTEVVY